MQTRIFKRNSLFSAETLQATSLQKCAVTYEQTSKYKRVAQKRKSRSDYSVMVPFDKEASQTRVYSAAGTRQFARLAQILRSAKEACSG
jgi:hypothetical protein